jgi:hypothetical protein
MRKQSALFAFAALALCYGAASAQEQMPVQHDASDAPASSQATSPERSPAVTLPEVKTRAPETTSAPVAETTGQAPKFEDRWSGQSEPKPPSATPVPAQSTGATPAKELGAERESAGDPRASPDHR